MSLEFLLSTHEYHLDGKPIPSVTQIIGAWDDPNPYWTPRGRDRGTAVHSAVQYLIQGDLDEDSVDPQWAGYLKAFKDFQATVNPEFLAVEEMIFNRQFWYAGRVDMRCKVFGKEALVDLKTGDSATVGLQLSAYGMCYPGRPMPTFALKLMPNGDYRFRKAGGLSDRLKFAAMAGAYNGRVSA